MSKLYGIQVHFECLYCPLVVEAGITESRVNVSSLQSHTAHVCLMENEISSDINLAWLYLFVFRLQNFKLLRDKTGQTRIGDLSPLDMKKVCYVFDSCVFIDLCMMIPSWDKLPCKRWVSQLLFIVYVSVGFAMFRCEGWCWWSRLLCSTQLESTWRRTKLSKSRLKVNTRIQ